jgi:NAD(P)-dependent dehydrogenase (short-subunit alcohol dehydrogenase family)
MSRVCITGSSDGLGLLAGRLLAAGGHSVTLRAQDELLSHCAALTEVELPR